MGDDMTVSDIEVNKNTIRSMIADGLVQKKDAEKMIEYLSAFRKAEQEEKTSLRFRITSTFWDMYIDCFSKGAISLKNRDARAFLRTALVDIGLLNSEQKNILDAFLSDDDNNHGILYFIDEWLRDVIAGKIQITEGDELEQKKGMKSISRNEKINAAIAVEKDFLASEIQNHQKTLSLLPNILQSIQSGYRDISLFFGNLMEKLNDDRSPISAENVIQSNIITGGENLSRLNDANKHLEKLENSIEKSLEKINGLLEEKKQISSILDDDSNLQIDQKKLKNEVGQLRQMHKMTCGPRGNHFPVAIEDFFPLYQEQVLTRIKLLQIIGKVDHIDPKIFDRTSKGNTRKIYPMFILLPSFGEIGVCWEPLNKYNRSYSQGRIALPIFTRRNVEEVVISALGDFRWQMQKELLGYLWLSEGLTGSYSDYYMRNKGKGDAKEKFISDYVLWIQSESEGIQKLDKEVREIFWRYLPFPDDVKQNLSSRGPAYKDLIEKDKRRSMSKGY